MILTYSSHLSQTCNRSKYKLIFADVLQSRLDFAKQLGADFTLLVTRDSKEDEVVKKIHELLGAHPDKSFDASGAQATVRMSLLVRYVFFFFFIK